MRKIFALLLLAPLASCALNSSPARTSVRDAPLTAGIFPLGGRISFNLSRPAHVAIFEVVPGRGVGLMYPSAAAQDRQLTAGLHQPFFGFSDFRWGYLPALPISNVVEGPRILYLIASERPLDLDRLIQHPTALRSELGLARFASYQPFSTIDDLDAMLLGGMPPTQYATDYYVIWPEPRYESPRVVYATLTCASGRTVTVAWQYVAVACPEDRSRATQMTPGSKQPPGVRKPVPVRPDPQEPGADGRKVRPETPDNPRETGSEPREPRDTRPTPASREPASAQPRTDPASRGYDSPSSREPQSTPSPSTGREIRSSGTQTRPATPQ
ncbi:hypothetical protein BH23GEM4_BH23GEM4_00030 [soil metagenome]